MIRKQFQYAIILFLLACITIGCGNGGKKPEESKQKGEPAKGTAENPIVMGFNPAESADVILVNGEALAQALELKTGYKYKTYVAQSYNALVTALQFDDIDFAWLPAFAFVQAEQHAGAEVLLKAVRNGEPFYYGAIVVRSDSPYRKIEDLKGKSIAWVAESSTSGYIFPMAAMIKMGIDPEKFFGHAVMAGKHDAVLIAVEKGTVDAGATFAADNQGIKGSWTQFLKGEDVGKIRPILFTDPIPSDTMSTSIRFREKYPDIVEQVTAAVKGLSDNEADKELLKKLYNIDAMVDAKSEDYAPVREAAKLLNIDVSGGRKKESETPAKEKESGKSESK